jgi:L-lactate dehydrogenase complex protein LldF
MAAEPISLSGAEFRQTNGLHDLTSPEVLAVVTDRSAKYNRSLLDAIPYYQEWREAARAIKAYAIANLDKLLVEFERKVAARGVTVLWAADAAEANRHVLDIARRHNVAGVVKSKSMLGEELDINHALSEAGIRAVETDLGEYIVQLAEQRPVHILTPAIHMSAADVGRLFAEKLREPFSAEHGSLTDIARRHLRDEFLNAGMGISGCNFAIAETGTIVVVENEGNAGLSTAAPPVHVALIGIEKVVPRLDDLPLMLNLLGRSASGQKLTAYTHFFGGPPLGRHLYVVLVDNGRSNVLKDQAAWSSLHCIRCGNCLNNCPVYRRVGGWAYGWVYPGPIGSILTPHLLGLKDAGELPFASSLCGACGEACPVKIDIPHQLVHLRHRAVREPSPANSRIDQITWTLWAWMMGGPRRYALAATAMRLGLRLAKFLPWHPGKLGAWTRGRELPPVPRRDFRKWWRKHKND